MGLFKRKPKNTKFWCISDKDDNNHFYTFTNTYDEALEYLVKLYVYKNQYEHFLQWCEFRNKDKSKDETVLEYIAAMEVNVLNYFNLGQIEYTPVALASLFRIYNGCVPLNCSFETDLERQIYLDSLQKQQGLNAQ